MNDGLELPLIRGRHLRYLLVVMLDQTRSEMTIPQLEQTIRTTGFSVAGAPGKAVSDSLRWAVSHGHATRVGHGRYVTGHITKQTRHRYRQRVQALWRSSRLPDAPTRSSEVA